MNKAMARFRYKNEKQNIKNGAIFCVLAICMSVFLIVNGIRHVEPASKIRQAQYHLQFGEVKEALISYVQGYGMALDAGARSTLVKYYGARMRQSLEYGRLDDALEYCIVVADILGKYDDEGSQSFLCLQIKESIKSQ